MINWRSVCALAVLSCVLQATWSEAQIADLAQPAPQLTRQGSALHLAVTAQPEAQQLVKARVRAEVLDRLLSPTANWALSCPAGPIPAYLALPELPDTPERTLLPIVSSSDVMSEAYFVELDRGSTPLPLNRLQIQFAGVELLAKVSAETSNDRETWQTCGEPQLVLLQVSTGELLELTTIQIVVDQTRYLRLTVPDANGMAISAVYGWHEEPPADVTYGVPVALGSMQELDTGQQLWPLILPHANLPIRSLSLEGSPAVPPRLLGIVRLDDGFNILYRLAGGTWLGGLEHRGLSLARQDFSCPDELKPANWGVLIESRADQPPLQLKRVQAEVAEVWLVYHQPAEGPVELWFEKQQTPTPPQLTELDAHPSEALALGAFNTLSLGETQTIEPAVEPTPAWQSTTQRYWKLASCIGAALLAVLIGSLLLKPQRPKHD